MVRSYWVPFDCAGPTSTKVIFCFWDWTFDPVRVSGASSSLSDESVSVALSVLLLGGFGRWGLNLFVGSDRLLVFFVLVVGGKGGSVNVSTRSFVPPWGCAWTVSFSSNRGGLVFRFLSVGWGFLLVVLCFC